MESKGSLVRFPAEAYIIILNFRLYPVDKSSAKAIQLKSSMTFIQRNVWTEIDLILKNMVAVYMMTGQHLYLDFEL